MYFQKKKKESYETKIEDDEWSEDEFSDEENESNSNIKETESHDTKEKMYNKDRYKIMGDIIEIYPSITCSSIPEFTYEKITMKDTMQVYSNGAVQGLYYTIKVKSITIDVCPAQVAAIKNEMEGIEMQSVNPHVYITGKINRNYFPCKHIKKLGTCIIYTRLASHNQRIAAQTTVIKIINGPIIDMNKKPKIVTLGLILTVPNDEDCIWLGSIVGFQNSIFVVTELSLYHAPVIIKLVCVILGVMDYTFKIIEK